MVKATIKIEDSKGERTTEKNFRGSEQLEAYRQQLRNRVETGATVTITRK